VKCNEFNAFEKYVNDYIIELENGGCSDYPSQPCDSNSNTSTTSTASAGSTNWTIPSSSHPNTTSTTNAFPTFWTTPSSSDPNTTTTRPESTTVNESCDSQCNCNCNCNFNIVPTK
jgi:hypothetical protein